MPREMNPRDTRISTVAGKYSASGFGTEGQRGRAEAVDHAAQRTEDVAEEHGSRLVCPSASGEEQPAADGEQQHLDPEDAGEAIEVESACRVRRGAAMSSEAKREPSGDQPGGDPGGVVEDFHVHGALPDHAAQHGGSGDAAEGHEGRRADIQQRQKRSLPERMHAFAGQQHQCAERGLVHAGQASRRRR